MFSPLATLDVGMDRVTLSTPAENDFHTLVRLVVGGICSRSSLSYEQTSELQLAVETLVSNRTSVDGTVVVEAGIEGSSLTVVVGPFESDEDPAARRAIKKLVGDVRLVRNEGVDWVELAVEAARPVGGS
jgi:hypothetical protein